MGAAPCCDAACSSAYRHAGRPDAEVGLKASALPAIRGELPSMGGRIAEVAVASVVSAVADAAGGRGLGRSVWVSARASRAVAAAVPL